MKGFLTILLTLLIANSLAFVGLLGYGAATGRFHADARQQYLATWRGEKLVAAPEVVEQVVEQETPEQASARIAAAQIQQEVFAREVQRDIEIARSMQASVIEARIRLTSDLEESEKQKHTFLAKLQEYDQNVTSEGFQKSLKTYSSMKPDVFKQDLMAMDEDRAVLLLANMKPDVVTKVLEKCETPQEQAKRLRLLQRIEEMRRLSLNQ